jgi:hypothetical protein
MKKNLKLLVVIILAAVISLFLPGCGQKAGQSTGAGGRIAMVVFGKETPGRYIVSVNSDGTGLIRLGRFLSISSHQNLWSDNGTLVYFEGEDDDPTTWLSIINADGTGQRRLFDAAEVNINSLCISQDAEKLLISYRSSRLVEEPFLNSVHVTEIRGTTFTEIEVETGEAKPPIVLDNIRAENAVYSPDGRQIAFIGNTVEPPTSRNVYTMKADGTGLRRLTDIQYEMIDSTLLEWSPDGAKILYGYETLFIDDITHYDDLFTVDAVTGESTNLTNNLDADDVEGCWSPDGKQIAFSSGNELISWATYIMDADGGNVRMISEVITQPAWSPDGRYIIGAGKAYDVTKDRWTVPFIKRVEIKTGKTDNLFQAGKEYSITYFPVWLEE